MPSGPRSTPSSRKSCIQPCPPVHAAGAKEEGIVIIGDHAIHQTVGVQPGALGLCLLGGDDVGHAKHLGEAGRRWGRGCAERKKKEHARLATLHASHAKLLDGPRTPCNATPPAQLKCRHTAHPATPSTYRQQLHAVLVHVGGGCVRLATCSPLLRAQPPLLGLAARARDEGGLR